MSNNTERRAFIGTIEARMQEGQEMPAEVRGVAAVVNQATDLGFAEEVISPGAFDEVLSDDVRVLGNHDPNQVLGRTASGTAKVFLTESGELGYSFTPDYENPTHVSWVALLCAATLRKALLLLPFLRAAASGAALTSTALMASGLLIKSSAFMTFHLLPTQPTKAQP